MEKIKTIALIILSTVLMSGCNKSSQPVSSSVLSDHQIVEAQFGNSRKLELEVVNTTQSITQGLSGRDELRVDGMLFIFNKSRIPQFWMKEMKFDLDLVWIKDMVIVEITEDVPVPDLDTPLYQLPTYSPSQLVDMVLEVKAGNVSKWKLSVGNLVLVD